MAALLALVLAVPFATTDAAPRAKVELSSKDGVWVGQRVTLTITLFTPDLFAGAPSFEMPAIPGVVVLPPAGSPIVGSEKVGDTTFTTQRHEFAIYAQRPGTVRIPAFPVRFESNAGFGKPTIKREVATQAASFEARMPPGAEGLGTVIAARGLEVKQIWHPEPKSLKVGDALTLTITTTAPDVPGMVLPPLRLEPIDGLTAYAKDPVIDDQTNRGELTGRRSDTVTFICTQPGTVTIPDQTLKWFDLDARALKTVKIAGGTFEVAPDPKGAADQGPSSSITTPPHSRHNLWWLLPVLAVAAAVGWLLFTRVSSWWGRLRRGYAESEAAYFAHFRKACRSRDPHAIYVALLDWLDHFGGRTLDEFIVTADDPVLNDAVTELRSKLFVQSASSTSWPEAGAFCARVRFARRHIQNQERAFSAGGSLPPLN